MMESFIEARDHAERTGEVVIIRYPNELGFVCVFEVNLKERGQDA